MIRTSPKILGALAVAGLVAAGGSAFTATSTIDRSQRLVGTVSQAVSGVDVSNVVYTLSPGTDTTTSVDFDIAQNLLSAALKGTIVTAAANTDAAVTCTPTQISGTTKTHLVCSFGAGVTNLTALTIVAR